MDSIIEIEGSNYGMLFYTPIDIAVGFFQKLLNKYYKENYVSHSYILILAARNHLQNIWRSTNRLNLNRFINIVGKIAYVP